VLPVICLREQLLLLLIWSLLCHGEDQLRHSAPLGRDNSHLRDRESLVTGNGLGL